MEKFNEKARALRCKEHTYPAKSADVQPVSKCTNPVTACAEGCTETQAPFALLCY